MNHASVNFTNKFWVSFVIVALLFQLAAPAGGVGAKSDASVPIPQAESDAPDGLTTLGLDIPPTEHVPDFAAQVAAQAAAQPVATVPLRLQASVTPAIYLPGKPVLIKWVVTGLEQNSGKNILVSI